MLSKEQQLWLMALSSPMVALNIKGGASYSIPSFWSVDTANKQDNLLKSSWGIESREGLLSTVIRMMDHGHATSVGGRYWAWHQSLPGERERAREGMPEVARLQDTFLDKTAMLTGRGGIRAWDLARMGFLLRNGLYLGYISEQEFDYLQLQLGFRALYWHHSWGQYLQAFFSGRLLWMTLGMEDPAEVEELLFGPAPDWLPRIFSEVINASDNPASYLPWDIQLDPLDRPESLGEEEGA